MFTIRTRERRRDLGAQSAHYRRLLQSGLDSLDSGLIGEYNGLDVRNSVIHPIWTDTRFLNQDAFTAVWSDSANVNITMTRSLLHCHTGHRRKLQFQCHSHQRGDHSADLWRLDYGTAAQSTWYGPVLGPLNLTLPGGGSLTRVRTQGVPASAPAGATGMKAVWVSILPRPGIPVDLRSPNWPLGLGAGAGDWSNTGESFNSSDEPSSLITHHSSLPSAQSFQSHHCYKLRAARSGPCRPQSL